MNIYHRTEKTIINKTKGKQPKYSATNYQEAGDPHPVIKSWILGKYVKNVRKHWIQYFYIELMFFGFLFWFKKVFRQSLQNCDN